MPRESEGCEVSGEPEIEKLCREAREREIRAEKYALLDFYALAARPEIEILAGGGIDRQVIKLVT
jgi:hypothetical protein